MPVFTVPGGNLLTAAFRLISTQYVRYYKFNARTLNSQGLYVSSYTLVGDIKASVQSQENTVAHQNGTEVQRDLVTVFIPANAVDLMRGVSGDQFWLAGVLYKMESQVSWFDRDGWVECSCIAIQYGVTIAQAEAKMGITHA